MRVRQVFLKRGTMKTTYSYLKRYFFIEVTLTGIVCLAALLVCPYLAYRGIAPGIMIVLMVPAAYQVWNTFVAIANPQMVEIDDEAIAFSAWGRTDRYAWNDVTSFRVREFPSAGKIYIRINNSGLLRGRYWLQTRVMTDGRELFQRICDLEYKIHPDTLKARARKVNSEYLEAEKASDDEKPKSRRHDRKGKQH
jgi:hypothetical protein